MPFDASADVFSLLLFRAMGNCATLDHIGEAEAGHPDILTRAQVRAESLAAMRRLAASSLSGPAADRELDLALLNHPLISDNEFLVRICRPLKTKEMDGVVRSEYERLQQHYGADPTTPPDAWTRSKSRARPPVFDLVPDLVKFEQVATSAPLAEREQLLAKAVLDATNLLRDKLGEPRI